MKLINPFDRLKKRESVPLSLFPANKITRTSFPIGRVVPLYTIDLMQGNRLKLSVDQVTRFMEMNGPVMQNYEVTLGAFFVPDVSFDRCFQSSWFRQNVTLTPADQKHVLAMRDFFNPATVDSLRVHPALVTVNQFGGNKPCSLADHLGYPCYSNIDFVSDQSPWLSPQEYDFVATLKGKWTNTDTSESFVDYFDIDLVRTSLQFGGVPYITALASSGNVTDTTASHVASDFGFRYILNGVSHTSNFGVLPFALWVLNKVFYGGSSGFSYRANNTIQFTYTNGADSFTIDYEDAFDYARARFLNSDNYLTMLVLTNLRYVSALYGVSARETGNQNPDISVPYTEMFKDYRLSDLVNQYWQEVSDAVNKSIFGEQSFNTRRWLAYNMIYADYFLNPIYTAREDFTDMVGVGYLHLANGETLKKSFTQNNTAAGLNSKLKSKTDLIFFGNYIANNELFPVLWKKDQLTSIVQTDASADVAIGSTIKENFYNRCYAKFKDLIARLGQDYRTNTSALYGHKPSDGSLLRTQVIGYKSFDVKVGEIAQTSSSNERSNLGQFAGYALSYNSERSNLFDWTADENGQVMVLCWIRPKFVAISNLCDRSIFKSQYLDYLIPEFGGVGYQDVPAKQLDYRNTGDSGNVKVGIQERYSEYMSIPNEVSGLMRTSMSYLNADRLDDPIYPYSNGSNPDWYKNLYMWNTPSLHRIFQVQDQDPIAMAAFFTGNVTRQLPAHIRTDF